MDPVESKVEILLPRTLDFREALAFSDKIEKLPWCGCYVFNFKELGKVEPFALLIVSEVINRFRQSRPTAKYIAQGHEAHGYAAHMGFFKAFGVRFGKAPGEAPGSDTYVPITFVNCDEVRRHAADEYSDIGEFIDRWSGKVAGLLLQTDTGSLFDAVQYSLREVVRNVLEHSESTRFAYCGQYWPTRKVVQIGLMDWGVGLQKTLSANPQLSVMSDRDAVQLALMPGVSRKGILPESRAAYDPWANSGFGLYMTSRLCREGGSFVLLSGSTAVELSETHKFFHAGAFSGTALQLELDLTKSDALSSRLETFREDGLRLARAHFGSGSLTASVASTMISKNFQ